MPSDLEPRRPFTRAEALAAGIPPATLRGSRFRRMFRGVYIYSRVPAHPVIDVQAALLIHPPSAFASHTSAAAVYRVAVPDTPYQHISVFSAADRRPRDHIRTHVVPAGARVETVNGMRVSAPTQLFLELAEVLNLVDLVVAGDNLVRLGRTTPEELQRAAAEDHRARAALARRAACLVREGVDSPLESRLRMLIVLAGLPEPEVNHKIYDELGHLLYRFDLSYPALRLAVEYDGRQHRADLDNWDHDNDRRDWLDHHDWMLVSVFSRGIYRQPDRTISRVVEALRLRGCKAVPRQLSEEWRCYFPVRN
jgi:hypothetical protein